MRTLVVFNTKAKDYQHAAEIRPFFDMIRGTVDTKDKFIAVVDAEVQEIRADKKREARFMKEQIELRRQLRKSREARILTVAKNMAAQGIPQEQIITIIATSMGTSTEEAQKFYDQATVAN